MHIYSTHRAGRGAAMALLLGWSMTGALGAQAIHYPESPRGNVVDDYAGRTVPDHYRWLEALDSDSTKAWVAAQNRVTFAYLEALPERARIRERLTRLWDYPKVSTPSREAGAIFFRKNSGLQKQSVLYRQQTWSAEPAAILDPNVLSPDGSLAVGGWAVSPDGRRLAYTTAQGGSDLQDIRIRDLTTGRDLEEAVRRVKFSALSWTRDSKGFYFARFKGSEDAANLQDANAFHQIWYHPLGGTDRLVFDRPENPNDGVGAGVSDDGRWLFTYSWSGTSNNRLWIADLGHPGAPRLNAPFRAIVPDEDAVNNPLGVVGDSIYLYTNWQAPRGRVVAVPLGDTTRSHWREVVPETADVINEVLLVGSRLVIVYLADVQSRLRLFDLHGAPTGEVPLPEPGTAAGLSGRNQDREFCFGFTSYLRPTTIYRYELGSGRLTTFHPATTPFDATVYETRAGFYESRDGTRVPIFITVRKGLRHDGSHPALLYGYGGFDVNLQPYYSPAVAAWLELGGVYAVANLRGGGEYGEAWHHAGMREHKQNVFDDFIAAAEFLIREGYTASSRLTVQGGSNGGLLVGAAMTQRPDLFRVALPAVGVMDMLRYQKFTGGKFWAEEYGSSDDSAAVGYLLAYSPLHNLKPGTCYPATLVTTADHDDRVVPSHSFKFAATLQADQACARPTLIRVETEGSHGYRPTDRVIVEIADEFAFALANLELASP